MLGAIAGDVICAIYSAEPVKTNVFDLFPPAVDLADNTMQTVAAA